MKLKSIAALVYEVKDLDKTAAFYEKLGFRAGKREAERYTVYVNWFSIEFRSGEPAAGKGQFTMVNVEDIKEFYNGVKATGIKLETDIIEKYGRKEFTVLDPDGYQLVFFEK